MLPPKENDKPPAFKWDNHKVKNQLKAVYDGQLSAVGKKGFNPYVYLHTKVTPLELRLTKGETSEELYNAIMALETTPKQLTKIDAPVQTVPTQELTPRGLKLNPPQ